MNWLMVKNDFTRNKMINLALLFFIVFAASLAISSVIMAVQTFTSIDELYEKAQPPHFLQMHKGAFNQSDIDEFMSTHEDVVDWQTIVMINVYGENLTIISDEDQYDLSDCRLDIGLVKQADEKDLLLNSKHEKVTLNKNEIGIPVILKEMYDMKIGDHVILNSNGLQREFVIKEFILDAQMNSTMASSTRILLSDEDFQELSGKVGEHEYLIEAYFTDTDDASSFQTAYENANLPKNGQAVTYTMIFLLSALTDIFTVFVLFIVSILLVVISFICVRFTIMATLEEEVSEIGILKAIGLPYADIRDIYLSKYKVLATAGVVIGYLLALFASGVLTDHISTTFGEVGISPLTVVLSLVIALIVYVLIVSYCKKILKKIKELTVVDALVLGSGFEKSKNHIKDGLYKSKKLPVNWLMGIREVSYHFKDWSIVFAVVLITVMMILIPTNLLNTMDTPEFINYMGSPRNDILIEVESGENLEKGYTKAKSILDDDASVKDYYEYRDVSVQTTDTEDEIVNLHIDSGDYSGQDLQYLSGVAPKNDGDIALSYLNSEKTGKTDGDKIILSFNGTKQEFLVSGIYQDVTSGGYTAKSLYAFPELQSSKYTFSINVMDGTNIEEKADEWSEKTGTGVIVYPMDEFIHQTLGGVTDQLKNVVLAIVIIGACIAMLITVLYLKLRLAKDVSDIVILKAIGFSGKDLKQQYLIKIGLVSVLGILVGILLTNVLGEKIVNGALGLTGLGIKQVKLLINPLTQYIFYPLLLLVLILFVTWLVVRTTDGYNIASHINE